MSAVPVELSGSGCTGETPVQKKQRRLSTRLVSVVTSGGYVAGTWDVPEICRIFQMKKMLAEKVPVDQRLVHGSSRSTLGARPH